MPKGIHKTESYWNSILTKEFLYNEHVNKRKSLMKIASELQCGTLRVTNKAKEYNLPSLQGKTQTKNYNNINKVKEAGFELLEEYKSTNTKSKFKCHCGNIFITTTHKIVSGQTKSCGCSRRHNLNHAWKGYEDLSAHEFGRYPRNAKKRGLEFKITIQDVWNQYIKQNKKCALTGENIYWDSTYCYGNASIDRIDNNKGYIENNIQIILKDLNIMKRHHEQKYFIELCQKVANYDKNN